MYIFLGLVLILATVVYKYLSRFDNYWKQRNIPFKHVIPIFGEKVILGITPLNELIVEDYRKFEDEPFYGTLFFNKPTLMIKDPDLIREIFVKDFDHFLDHSLSFINEKLDPVFAQSLFFRKGQAWKDMRSLLSPLFTGRKMRIMFDLVVECSQDLIDLQVKKAQSGKPMIYEMKEMFGRLTGDVIASCAFGIKCNSSVNPNNEFYQMEKKTIQFSPFRMAMVLFCTKICEIFQFGVFPKYIIKYYQNFVKDTMRIREEKQIYRPDMLQLMMQVRKGEIDLKNEEKLDNFDDKDEFSTANDTTEYFKKVLPRVEITEDGILAQILIFLLAGYDGPSTVLSFTVYELALNSEIQNRLQDEIDRVLQNGAKLTYEKLRGMKYLDMVVSETLRKYPIAAMIERLCTTQKEYTVEANNQKLNIESGMVVMVPVFGIHYDPKYYPNPEKFDPERFNDENKHNINDYTYLPFGTGPRNCIGSRFALMEIKIALFFLLSKFNFCVCPKTQIPLKFAKSPTQVVAEKGVWLELKLRN